MNRQNTLLWLFSVNGPLNPISIEEKEFSKTISPSRSKIYQRSRGCIRQVLSNLFDIQPLDIPLNSPIGKPPKINNDFGYISLSHCIDKILIGWSEEKIGVDIERNDRKIESSKIIKRFFSDSEQNKFLKFEKSNLNQEFIKNWVLKEAAIKWQYGNIAKDIREWEISSNYKQAIHLKSKFSLNTLNLKLKDWHLGVATSNEIKNTYPLLCLG